MAPKSEEELNDILKKFDPTYAKYLPYGKRLLLEQLTPVIEILESEKETFNENQLNVLEKLKQTAVVLKSAIDNSYSNRIRQSLKNLKMPFWRRTGGKTKKRRHMKQMKGGDGLLEAVIGVFGFFISFLPWLAEGAITYGGQFFSFCWHLMKIIAYFFPIIWNAYVQAKMANSWMPGKGQNKWRLARMMQGSGNEGRKRRTKRNKRKSAKRSRTHKK
jgi:hypothetical protein